MKQVSDLNIDNIAYPMAKDTDRGSLVFEVKPGFENLQAGAIMLIAGVALFGFFPFGQAHL